MEGERVAFVVSRDLRSSGTLFDTERRKETCVNIKRGDPLHPHNHCNLYTVESLLALLVIFFFFMNPHSSLPDHIFLFFVFLFLVNTNCIASAVLL